MSSQVNKFEQVSSDDHQMSLAGGQGGPMSDVKGAGVGSPMSDVQGAGLLGPYRVKSKASWVMVTC